MAKKRRGHGEGAIVKRKTCTNCKKICSSATEENLKTCPRCGAQLPKEGRWMGQITVGYTAEGKRKRATFYGKTRKEVADKINNALYESKSGTFVEPNKVTVGEWLDCWLEDYARGDIRQTTYEQYEYLIRRHIKPTLGGAQLRKLQGPEVQRLYNRKEKEGLSARTVRLIHVVLHSALSQALKDKLVAQNVTEATRPPRVTRAEIKVLTDEQLQDFLTVAEGTRLYPAVLVLLGTGLRRGEMLGLKWQDIDFEESCLYVRRSLVKTNEGPKIQETKTGRERNVPIPEDVLKALKTWKARQAEERLKLGEAYQDQDFVFATTLGTPIAPRNFYRYFKELLIQAETLRVMRETGKTKKEALQQVRKSGDKPMNGVTIHALRHTYATMLLQAGEHPKVVQELLGHSSISMTLDIYSHVVPGLKHQAAATINGLLKRKPSKAKQM